jgi:hypothetical protein
LIKVFSWYSGGTSATAGGNTLARSFGAQTTENSTYGVDWMKPFT